jgi:hypothetical protein
MEFLSELFNSIQNWLLPELEDNYALETIRVKGQGKVACHMMFAVIALTAKKIFTLLPQTV